MADKVLHQGCTMECSACQGAITVPAPINQAYKVGGQLVLLKTDSFQITGGANCLGPLQTPQPLPPCPASLAPQQFNWAGESQLAKVNSVEILLQTSTGTFTNYAGMQTTVTIVDSNPATPAKAT